MLITDAGHILRGGLLVEATGPTSPIRNTEPGGLDAGLIANDLCNERTAAVRTALDAAGNKNSAVQIVGGIRQRYDWYTTTSAVILDDAAYEGNGVRMNEAFEGDRAVARVECVCPDAYANEEPVRRAHPEAFPHQGPDGGAGHPAAVQKVRPAPLGSTQSFTPSSRAACGQSCGQN